MKRTKCVSIIVNNYNYGRFLGNAIQSALDQTYSNTEVIVVDDGSTDHSRDVITQYSDRLTTVLKRNGGQASAFNAGFAVSRGDVIVFLDADDFLLPTALENAVALFEKSAVAKVHWPLWEVDEQGRKTGRLIPANPLSEGDLRESVIDTGPHGRNHPPTTGNAWSRNFLKEVLPMPEDAYRICADAYLFTLVPLFGYLRVLGPQACYRVHGSNLYWSKTAADRYRDAINLYDHRCLALSNYLRAGGTRIEPEVWKAKDEYYGWMTAVLKATDELASVIPAGACFILVDENQWSNGQLLAGRHDVPFLERNGQYWGAPTDDAAAIIELERLRSAGANFMVFGWPCFWWLEHYLGLNRYLRSNYRCLLENKRVIVFDVRKDS